MYANYTLVQKVLQYYPLPLGTKLLPRTIRYPKITLDHTNIILDHQVPKYWTIWYGLEYFVLTGTHNYDQNSWYDKIIYKIEDIYAEIDGIVLILLNYKSKRLLSVSSVLDFSPKIRKKEKERKHNFFQYFFFFSHQFVYVVVIFITVIIFILNLTFCPAPRFTLSKDLRKN